ncbi:MAG: cation transporter [Nitrospirota bacterium]
MPASEKDRISLLKTASVLALITIFYNIAEGFVSIFFGLEDETIALLGFGIDSYVEVISGIGIWHMIKRIKENKDSALPDRFERRALRITGTAFYILAVSLCATSIFNLYYRHIPETTLWGIIIALVSIVFMLVLTFYKIKVGRELNSQAIIADANCSKTCLYLSAILLLSSAGYEITGISWFDSAGAILIAALSLKEGREAFQKRKGTACGCQTCSS